MIGLLGESIALRDKLLNPRNEYFYSSFVLLLLLILLLLLVVFVLVLVLVIAVMLLFCVKSTAVFLLIGCYINKKNKFESLLNLTIL